MMNQLLQSGDADEALLAGFKALPNELQSGLLQYVTNNPDMPANKVAELLRGALEEYTQAIGRDAISINGQSAVNEAALLQGGYDAGVASAIQASAGVGADPALAQQAAADFARMASQAIANGLPLDQVRFADPALTDQAKAEIYAQVAGQQGTTPEEIAQKYEAAKAQDMAAIQGAVFGGAAGQPSFGNLLWGEAQQPAPEQQAAQANPLALALAGNENIFASLASMNGGLVEANRGDLSQLRTQFASQTEQRGLGDPFSLA